MKICTVCKIEKSTDDFFRTKKNGLRGDCKICFNEKRKLRYAHNKEKELVRNKIYREQNKEKIKTLRKTYAINNKDKVDLAKKKWVIENPEKRKQAASKYQRNRRQDIFYRLLDSFKTSFGLMLKKNKASAKLKVLNYDRETLMAHIESTWTDGMSWENYGKNGWHIDHIKPLSSFDINDPEEIKKAWALDNLQALWAFDNLSKSSNYMGQKYYYRDSERNEKEQV